MKSDLIPSNYISTSPYRIMRDMEKEMNRFFDDFIQIRPSNSKSNSSYFPTADLTEENGHYLLSMDLPGFKKDNIEVEIGDHQIEVKGERKNEISSDKKNEHYSERSYGSFRRVFSLNQKIDEGKAEASFSDGVLNLYLPKIEATKGRRIELQSEKDGFLKKLFTHNEKDKKENKEAKVQ